MTSVGTPSQGEKSKTTHVKCRRCDEKFYHMEEKVCSSRGLGRSEKHRSCA